MAHQATLNGNPIAALTGMVSGLGEVGGDVITLATLQSRLFAEDVRDSSARAVPGLVALAISIPLALACFTLALGGLAYWLAAELGWSLGLTLLTVAAIGLIVSALLSWLGLRSVRSSTATFRRSREELERNVAWLRTVLAHSGR